MRIPSSGPKVALVLTIAVAALALALYVFAVDRYDVYETEILGWLFAAAYMIALGVYVGVQLGRSEFPVLARTGVIELLAWGCLAAATVLFLSWGSIEDGMPDVGIFDGSIFMVPLYIVQVALIGVGVGAVMSEAHDALRSRGTD